MLVDLEILKFEGPQRYVCIECLSDNYLKYKLNGEESKKCFYCNGINPVIEIEKLAELVMNAMKQFYQYRGPFDEYDHLIEPNCSGYPDKSESILSVIEKISSTNSTIAEDIRRILYKSLEETEWCKYLDNYFSRESIFENVVPNNSELWELWDKFENNILHESRFLGSKTVKTLNEIFGYIFDQNSIGGNSIILDVGPDSKVKEIYRGRVFQHSEEIKEVLRRPDEHLSAPPKEKAIAGRMNPDGISVFYGATESSVAIAELRPPVGSRVVVGKFEIIRNLKLLDLGNIKSKINGGSPFDEQYIEELKRLQFIEGLNDRISQPVLPHDEKLTYPGFLIVSTGMFFCEAVSGRFHYFVAKPVWSIKN